MLSLMRYEKTLTYPDIRFDPVIDAIAQAAAEKASLVSPTERGIALYQAAKAALLALENGEPGESRGVSFGGMKQAISPKTAVEAGEVAESRNLVAGVEDIVRSDDIVAFVEQGETPFMRKDAATLARIEADESGEFDSSQVDSASISEAEIIKSLAESSINPLQTKENSRSDTGANDQNDGQLNPDWIMAGAEPALAGMGSRPVLDARSADETAVGFTDLTSSKLETVNTYLGHENPGAVTKDIETNIADVLTPVTLPIQESVKEEIDVFFGELDSTLKN